MEAIEVLESANPSTSRLIYLIRREPRAKRKYGIGTVRVTFGDGRARARVSYQAPIVMRAAPRGDDVRLKFRRHLYDNQSRSIRGYRASLSCGLPRAIRTFARARALIYATIINIAAARCGYTTHAALAITGTRRNIASRRTAGGRGGPVEISSDCRRVGELYEGRAGPAAALGQASIPAATGCCSPAR